MHISREINPYDGWYLTYSYYIFCLDNSPHSFSFVLMSLFLHKNGESQKISVTDYVT